MALLKAITHRRVAMEEGHPRVVRVVMLKAAAIRLRLGSAIKEDILEVEWINTHQVNTHRAAMHL